MKITNTFLIQESYNLPSSSQTLRAVSKGDTLLVVCRLKVCLLKCLNYPKSINILQYFFQRLHEAFQHLIFPQTSTHRFRVKFTEGKNSCEECAQQLSTFFPVKTLLIGTDTSQVSITVYSYVKIKYR